MMIAPNMSILQLKLTGVGFGAAGKKMKIQASVKNPSAPQLMNGPAFPRRQRLDGNRRPRKRFMRMQEMHTM